MLYAHTIHSSNRRSAVARFLALAGVLIEVNTLLPSTCTASSSARTASTTRRSQYLIDGDLLGNLGEHLDDTGTRLAEVSKSAIFVATCWQHCWRLRTTTGLLKQ